MTISTPLITDGGSTFPCRRVSQISWQHKRSLERGRKPLLTLLALQSLYSLFTAFLSSHSISEKMKSYMLWAQCAFLILGSSGILYAHHKASLEAAKVHRLLRRYFKPHQKTQRTMQSSAV